MIWLVKDGERTGESIRKLERDCACVSVSVSVCVSRSCVMLDAVVRCTQRTQGVTAEGKTHMRARVCV